MHPKTICMKYQSLFYGKMKNTYFKLLSTEVLSSMLRITHNCRLIQKFVWSKYLTVLFHCRSIDQNHRVISLGFNRVVVRILGKVKGHYVTIFILHIHTHYNILPLFDVFKNCRMRNKQCKPRPKMRRLIWIYTVC